MLAQDLEEHPPIEGSDETVDVLIAELNDIYLKHAVAGFDRRLIVAAVLAFGTAHLRSMECGACSMLTAELSVRIVKALGTELAATSGGETLH